MKKIIFTTLLIYICGINNFAQSNVTKEEYFIYAKVVKNIYFENLKEYKTKFQFLILNKTFNADIDKEDYAARFKGLIKNFRQRNRNSLTLEKLPPIKYEYKIISKHKVDKLLAIGSRELDRIKEEYKRRNVGIGFGASEIVWKPFYNKYQNSDGYYQFSGIGFSSDRRFALVSVERESGSSGESRNFILKKIKGKWMIYTSYGSNWVE